MPPIIRCLTSYQTDLTTNQHERESEVVKVPLLIQNNESQNQEMSVPTLRVTPSTTYSVLQHAQCHINEERAPDKRKIITRKAQHHNRYNESYISLLNIIKLDLN
ncbi:hypothetical protein V8G54_027716 [Vigna mungo]|uniref:Uncharacterized protein n=1 Tax=Vigna mungo TaxID=3915 RepID=A0AAQ3MR90_VIGMU